jgi:hypothetical protein
MADGSDSRSDDALLLSELAGRTVTAKDGHRLGQVAAAIVRLDPGTAAYPQVIGIVIRVDRRDLFVPAEVVTAMAAQSVALSTARLELRPFERRPGEVLLKRDLLGHRLIDVPAAQLVRARDVELRQRDGRWLLVGLDVSPTPASRPAVRRRPATRLPGMGRLRAAHRARGQRIASGSLLPPAASPAGADRGSCRRCQPGRECRDPRGRGHRQRAGGRRDRGAGGCRSLTWTRFGSSLMPTSPRWRST